MIQFDEDSQNRKLNDIHKREEEELMQMLSLKHGLEYINLSTVPIGTDALAIIPEAKAREAKMASFGIINKNMKIAIHSPTDEKTREMLTELTDAGYTQTLYLASMASLEKAWDTYKDISFTVGTKAGALDVSSEAIAEIMNQAKTLPDIKKIIEEVLKMNKSHRLSRILETILAGALATEASDIHVEPEEAYVRLRYRLDGVLVDVLNFDIETYGLILSRIKLLSGLKLNIKKDAQDGRFSVKLDSQDIEIRTSILPGAYNESIVLRLLNPKSISVPMEELGIPDKLLKILSHEISRPNGMILTTGPTGSGKTTTLYAFLKKIHNPGIKIITIEDPIEYHLPGIVQTQTNDKGYGFLEGLRSALRQDPDVIMIGEIRDSETASIAINSAQTGHLVFSTLHTNSAAGAFPRLIDLGVNSQILTSAINISLAQRLLRKLCQFCKKETTPEGKVRAQIEAIVESIVDRAEVVPVDKIWSPAGCEKCNFTGYKGRIGIYEAIVIDGSMETTIESNPSEREIAKVAEPQGIMTMRQDGIIKVLKGVTSLEELERVIDIEK